MPAVYRHTWSDTTLILWETLETEEQLSRFVDEQDLVSAGRFRTPERRIGHMAWRAALRQVVGREVRIAYNGAGAPYIKRNHPETPSAEESSADTTQDLFISASHTGGMAAVIVSSRPCAIDIEPVSRDVNRLCSRFMSPAERELPGSSSGEFPITVWCAKEALYKFSGRRELNFLTDLQITAADPETGRMTGRIGEICGIRLDILRFGRYVAVHTASADRCDDFGRV